MFVPVFLVKPLLIRKKPMSYRRLRLYRPGPRNGLKQRNGRAYERLVSCCRDPIMGWLIVQLQAVLANGLNVRNERRKSDHWLETAAGRY